MALASPRLETKEVQTQDFSSSPNAKHPGVHFRTLNSFARDAPSDNESCENFVSDNFEGLAMRPRSASHHLSSVKVPSRTWLKIQANIWRGLMAFAHGIPKVHAPAKTRPTFVRQIHTAPNRSHPIELLFYTPPDYYKLRDQGHRFPIVVNFHGGGFCLGAATDDQNWARVCLKSTSCVVVSVEYRLAPEHPFPTAVDDGVDALLYLSSNAEELGVDPTRIALSGFSAGANLTFTVPLRLEYHTKRHAESALKASSANDLSRWPSTADLLEKASTNNPKATVPPTSKQNDPFATPAHEQPFTIPSHSTAASIQEDQPPHPHLNLRIVTIIAWYPLLDWTVSRAQKKRSSRNPPKTLPKVFTDLFDYSYLPPPDHHGWHCSPYASPGLAPSHMLRDGLPADIQLWLCEWDMLLAEGQEFSKRLEAAGKSVDTTLIESVPHGFDQSPNPFRDQAKIDGLYQKACVGLRQAFSD